MTQGPRRQAGSGSRFRRFHGVLSSLAACLACTASTALLAQRAHSRGVGASSMTSIQGVVGDSIHGGPLAGAVVMLDGQPRAAVTDSIGRFRLDSVSAGLYRVGIFHPILDSLGTSLATRPVRFNAGKPILISLATPSGRTLRHAICPEMPPRASGYEHGDSGIAVLVGRVLDPDSDIVPVEGAEVTLAWVQTEFAGTAVQVTHYQRTTTTSGLGDFRFCALPTGLTGVLRVTGGPDRKTAVERELALDDRIVTMATLHLSAATDERATPSHETAVLTGDIERPDGTPFAGATVILQGTRDSIVADSSGAFTMRGLPVGTHMVLVRSIGFEPVSDVVELTSRSAQHLSVALTTPARELDPVVVEAHRLAIGYARVGFDRRRQEGVGQFLTADEIAAKHASTFSELFSSVSGIRLAYTPGGTNLANERGADACLVYVVDGQPFNRLINGELDASIRPNEIGALEIYSGASVPVQFRVRSLPSRSITGAQTEGSDGCATVVIWTKPRLGLRGEGG